PLASRKTDDDSDLDDLSSAHDERLGSSIRVLDEGLRKGPVVVISASIFALKATDFARQKRRAHAADLTVARRVRRADEDKRVRLDKYARRQQIARRSGIARDAEFQIPESVKNTRKVAGRMRRSHDDASIIRSSG